MKPTPEQLDRITRAIAAYHDGSNRGEPESLDLVASLLDAFEAELPEWLRGEDDPMNLRSFIADHRDLIAQARVGGGVAAWPKLVADWHRVTMAARMPPAGSA